MRSSRRRLKTYKALGTAQLEAIAELFAELSEPSRLRILQALQNGEASVGELVERCGIKQANMSKQLGALTSAGIVGRRRDGNRVIYRIAMPMVMQLCSVVCNGVAEQAIERARMLSQPFASGSN